MTRCLQHFNFLSKLTIFFIACYIVFPTAVYANCRGQTPKCSTASNCKPKMKSNGIYYQNASSQINSACVRKESENGCFNSTPVSYVGSYNMPGSRSCSSGSNCKNGQRNHLGSDLGTGGKTNVLAYAAADGEIAYYKPNSDHSGRTLVIKHQKHCDGTNGSKYYTTIYRHLYKVYKTSGSVKKGEKIGIVGGSNYVNKGPCDNPSQPGSCTNPHYAIHLHLEVMDGAASGAASTGAANTYQSACGDLQALCGGCSNNIKKCPHTISSSGNGETASASDMTMPDGSTSSSSDGSDDEAPKCLLSSALDSQTCIFCNLFKVIFNAASNMALTAIQKLAAPAKDLTLLGFLIWMAIYVLKNIASFQGAAPGEMIKGIIFQGFRVACVVFVLTNGMDQAMNLTLNPVMETGLSFSRSLNENSNCDSSADYMKNIRGYDAKGLNEKSLGGLPMSMGESIVCTIKNLEDSVGVLAALGKYSMCIAWHERDVGHLGFLPHFGYLTTGIVLWCAGMLLVMTFPWCLVDCILQLCIAAALLPCSIASFAFKVTANYLPKIWDFFMNAMFNLVFMAILAYIINSMFASWIGIDTEMPDNFDPARFTQIGTEGLAWWGLGAFKIAALCFLFFCFFDEAKEMADEFATGISLDIGKKVGGTVNNAGKSVGKKAAAVGKKAATAVGESANSLAGNWVRSKTNQAKGQILKTLGGRAIIDSQGNVSGYQMRFNVFGHVHTRTVTKDASGVWTQTKETHQRTESDKAFKPMKDANGNTTYAVKVGTKGGTAQYQQMNRSVDAATGNIIYTSQDGKSQLITDKDGNQLQYKLSTDNGLKQIKTPGSVQNINDSFMKQRILRDKNGNIISFDAKFQNVSSKYLVNKDGSTNMNAFNQIMNGVEAKNREAAMAAMVRMHMQARGQAMDNRFKSLKTQMNPNGSITMVQINNDGSQQVVNAQMVNGQMVISNQITDTKGNVTIRKTNGIQTKTTTRTLQKNGTFASKTIYGFTDEANSRSRISKPLDKYGAWGYGIDPTKAMAGFNVQEFNEHILQLNQ